MMNTSEKGSNGIEKETQIKEEVSSYSTNVINKINDSTSKFIFKTYLNSKDKLIFDEELILDNKIKELHQQKTDYLNSQPDLNIKKRFILFDWIIEVTSFFHFKRKTYYSCINLIEIFFSKCKVNTNQIQLIGITCLLISAKNEESIIPELSYFALVCNNTYSKTEIDMVYNGINEIMTALNEAPEKGDVIKYNNINLAESNKRLLELLSKELDTGTTRAHQYEIKEASEKRNVYIDQTKDLEKGLLGAYEIDYTEAPDGTLHFTYKK